MQGGSRTSIIFDSFYMADLIFFHTNTGGCKLLIDIYNTL